jgi:hypothetical protein
VPLVDAVKEDKKGNYVTAAIFAVTDVAGGSIERATAKAGAKVVEKFVFKEAEKQVFKEAEHVAVKEAEKAVETSANVANKTAPDGRFYSVAFETQIASDLYPGKDAYSHFKAANTALANAIASDASFANSIKELGIIVPVGKGGTITGRKIDGWVWHHSVDAGVMQLVPQTQHTAGSIFWETMHPGGRGGMAIWGGGYRR